MSEKIKDYVGIALIVAMLVVAVTAWQFVQSYGRQIEPSSFKSFSVSGQGKTVAVPDVGEFTFSVLTEGGKDVGSLQVENTKKMNKAIDFVKQNGVDSKDIKTQNYNISPKYQYYNCPYNASVATPCPPAVIVGYTVTQSVQVKVRDFTKIGDILSGVVKNGANSVSELNFTIDDPTSVQDVARVEAIKKAEAKAKSIADAAGFSLGQLLSIQESTTPVPRPYLYNSMMKAEATGMGGAAPSVEPGSEDVTVNITLSYEIR